MSGHQLQYLARAMLQREITHHLRGGSHNIGWGALLWQEMVGTNEVQSGRHHELCYLPNNIANFLHEFQCSNFASLQLPPLPSDCSCLDVYAMRRPQEIACLLHSLMVT
jgi:hypothetical protein